VIKRALLVLLVAGFAFAVVLAVALAPGAVIRHRPPERPIVLPGTSVVAASLVRVSKGAQATAANPKQGQVTVPFSVASEDGSIKINGQPFFPIITWAQSAAEVQNNVDIGINVFMGVDGNAQELSNAITGRAYEVPGYGVSEPSGPQPEGTIGYHLPDEADGYGILPYELPITRRVERTGRLIFQTLTVHYSSQQSKLEVLQRDGTMTVIDDAVYREYMNNADVLLTAVYPRAHTCNAPGLKDVSSIYYYQRELQKQAGTRPTGQWLEVNQIEGRCGSDPISSAQTRQEAFLAIAGRADALGYFTYGWPGGVVQHFDVRPEVAEGLANLSREIQELAPVLLSRDLPFVSGPNDPIKIGGRRYKGNDYLIAVNSTDHPVTWRRKLTAINLGNQTLSEYWTNQRIQVRNGVIAAKFASEEVRLFRWRTL